jgi:hypothetical protein
MRNTGFIVYWIGVPNGSGIRDSYHRHFEMSEMTDALKFMETLRETDELWYVGMVSQNPNSVGKPGVSDKLPDDYSWSKQHRSDAVTGFRSIIAARSNQDDTFLD